MVTVAPSMEIDALEAAFATSCAAWPSDAAEPIAPAIPFILAIRASVVMPINLGSAVAASMPRITITTTSSIKVKPDCRLYMFTTP